MPPSPTVTPLVSAISAQDVEQIWREYQQSRNVHLLDLLIVAYLPLVRTLAQGIAARLPRQVEVDDLVQEGVLGLRRAILKFNPRRKVQFTTFMTYHVRGAMRDSLRAADWAPRLVQTRSRIVQEAVTAFEMSAGRKPSEAELVHDLAQAGRNVQAVLRDARRIVHTSLSQPLGCGGSNCDRTGEETLAARNAPDPVTEAQRRELRELITRSLTRGERLVLVLYYYEKMTMKEIGQTLDLSESRVSQMCTSVIKRLKAVLTTRGQLLETLAELPAEQS
jgi:RNA polymerase sigma factor FliA